MTLRDTAAVTMKVFVCRGPGRKAFEERPQPEITAARTVLAGPNNLERPVRELDYRGASLVQLHREVVWVLLAQL